MKPKFFFIACLLLLGSLAGRGQEIRKIQITDLEQVISDSKTPLIVNFWATFCVPCIEEIPYFQSQVKAHEKEKVQLLLVSLDLPEKFPAGIRSFAVKRKITAPIVWLNETNADYFCPRIDEKWSGAIPASLFVNNATGYRQFYEEQLTEAELKEAIRAMLVK